jgi:PAS domain S-box-containing protein
VDGAEVSTHPELDVLADPVVRAVLDSLPIAVQIIDGSGTTLVANAARLRLNGEFPDDQPRDRPRDRPRYAPDGEEPGGAGRRKSGQHRATPVPAVPDEVDPGLREILDTVLTGRRFRGILPDVTSDGAVRPLAWQADPVRASDGQVVAAVGVAVDAEAGTEREQASNLLGALFSSAPVGLGVFDLEGRFTRVNPVLAEMNGVPAQDHIGRTVQEVAPQLGARAHAAVLNVLLTGRPVRDLELNTVPGTSPGPERVFLTSFVRLHDEHGQPVGAGCLVIEVTRQRRLEREQASATARLALTSRASEILGASLDPAATLDHLCGLLVPSLADHVFIDLREQGGRLRRSAIRHAPGLMVAPRLQRPVGSFPDYEPDHPSRRAAEDGTVTLRRDLDLESTDPPLGPDPGLSSTIGVVSYIVLPMVVGGRPIGAVSLLTSASGRRYDTSDVRLAQELVSRGAVALANALSYERQRSAAVALQRSLLPETLPILEGVETAWRYVPGMDGTEVGGDWIEAFELAGGRVAAVVGDVMGRGLRAAAVMGQLRTAVRTLALTDPPPAELMTRLDHIVAGLRGEQIVTCVYCVYDPARNVITLANAGHVPPILLLPDGWKLITEALAVPLGVGGVDFFQTDVVLPAGATIALYTDGLVEQPGADLDDAIAGLAGRLWAADSSLDAKCEAALSGVPESVGGDGTGFDDDVALLLLQAAPAPERNVVRVRLPADPASVCTARRVVRQALLDWDLSDEHDDDLLSTAALLISEVATNAVRHSRGDIEIQVRRGDASVWIEVQDDDSRPPRLRHASPEDEGGRGLALVHDLATAWGSRSTPTGKVVWLRLDLRSPQGRSAGLPTEVTHPGNFARPDAEPADLRVLDLRTPEAESPLDDQPTSRTRRRRHVRQE